MHWFDWFIAGWLLLGAFISIANVGKPKEATTPLVAAISAAITVTLIGLLLWSHGAFA